MFKKILIANRGEIACRVIATARKMGIQTVAVYSEADKDARHVALADEAVLLGPAPSRESYLVADKIIAAAKATGAEAIHPGYGFLSENEAFAKRCEDEGIAFIGPRHFSIAAMGDKIASKKLANEAKVNTIPGYNDAIDTPEQAVEIAKGIGYPVMIKAAAGGGGRGMRRVDRAEDFAAALQSARSEAENAFASGELILEKAIIEPRHIEIQVFADKHGNVVHLGERDCSVQRRHQKVIEESPSPAVSPELRARMGAVSVAAARAIGYVGAGTLEFLLAPDGAFYFMEMNTRLQVEHAVTEAVVGVDLVEWQLRVALGEPLPLSQNEIDTRRAQGGHAIEVRLCAEDPQQNFLPQSGTVARWRAPREVRTDHALADGLVVSPYYDSMLAKIVAHGTDRTDACRRLAYALDDCLLLGLPTNRAFLYQCVTHSAFLAGDVSTAFIERHFPAVKRQAAVPDAAVCQAGAVLLTHLRKDAARRYPAELQGWASSRTYPTLCRFTLDGEAIEMRVRALAAQCWEVSWDGGTAQAEIVSEADGRLTLALGDRLYPLEYAIIGTTCHFLMDGVEHAAIDTTYAKAERNGAQAGSGRISAPMNGRVVAVHVAEGEAVSAGQVLLVVEAMKMEHSIAAPLAGEVKGLFTQVGAQVAPGGLLMEIAAA